MSVAAAPRSLPLSPPPLAVYVHVPWCVRKCPYCDFNSHERKQELPVDAYVAALVDDLECDLPLVWGRTVHSVFFGGGTPSLFPPAAIGAFLDAASARLRFAPGLEVSLEANPGTIEHGRFEDYRVAGVNRLSLGVQSFDDDCLRRLGRIHDGGEAEAAVRLARAAGFENFNLDLMYALPGQDRAMAERDVQRALSLGPTHVSHYQLTLEPNTRFHARPPAGLPDDDGAWDIQEHCGQLLAEAGFEQYEISAHARAGRECLHNLNYWRYGDYLGLGAGAHGKITLAGEDTILRRHRLRQPAAYLAADGRARIAGEQRVAPTQRPFEFMLNALRLVEGFEAALFEQRTGVAASSIEAELSTAEDKGWIHRIEGRITVTALGRRFNNDLVSLFLA